MLPMKAYGQQADQLWKMHFTSTPRCVPLVRSQVAKALHNWGLEQGDIDRALLVCSELATNAVQHAHQPGRRFEVRVALTDTHCLIEVSDASDTPPQQQHAGGDDEHGRGLQLVAALAEETGHHARDPIGKTVWARLLLAPAEGATDA